MRTEPREAGWDSHPDSHHCQQGYVAIMTNGAVDSPHQLEGTRRNTDVLEGCKGCCLENQVRWSPGQQVAAEGLKDKGSGTQAEAARSVWGHLPSVSPASPEWPPGKHSEPLGKENASPCDASDTHSMLLLILTRFSISVRASMYVLTLPFWWSKVYRSSVA